MNMYVRSYKFLKHTKKVGFLYQIVLELNAVGYIRFCYFQQVRKNYVPLNHKCTFHPNYETAYPDPCQIFIYCAVGKIKIKY